MEAVTRAADNWGSGSLSVTGMSSGGTTMSFFHWVREGVRQAVVLGFADAIEDVGTRSRDEDFGASLAQSLRERLAASSAEPTVIESQGLAKGRRRLGRSLEAMQKSA